jgi:hypothetical protein
MVFLKTKGSKLHHQDFDPNLMLKPINNYILIYVLKNVFSIEKNHVDIFKPIQFLKQTFNHLPMQMQIYHQYPMDKYQHLHPNFYGKLNVC